MKRSFSSHQEVAHVWAAQSQSDGHGSNMLFDGPSIYSYGTHFEIARIVEPGVVLFRVARYSPSTAKHQCRVRSAVSHMRVFNVPSMTDHVKNAEYMLETLRDNLSKIPRMRKNSDWALDAYKRDGESAMKYAELFKREIGANLHRAIVQVYGNRNNPLTPAVLEQLKKRAAIDREKTKAERRIKEARAVARKKELQSDFDGWKHGTVASLPWEASNMFPVALRIHENEIQTSKGATIPLIEARKLWHIMEAKGSLEGVRVGHYTVTGIKETDLVVGCHTIPMSEVSRMAVALHLTA